MHDKIRTVCTQVKIMTFHTEENQDNVHMNNHDILYTVKFRTYYTL